MATLPPTEETTMGLIDSMTAFGRSAPMNYTNSTVAALPQDNSKLGFGQLEDYPEFLAAYHINFNYLFFIIAIGFPGNLAALVTISQLKPLTSSSLYIALLSVSDTLSLLAKLLTNQLLHRDYDIGPWGCRMLPLFGTTFVMFANWILVTITAERFVAIWFPFKVNQWSMKKIAIAIMSALFVVIFSLNLHFLWTYTDYVHPMKGVGRDCKPLPEYEYFVDNYWMWVDGLVVVICPCVIMFVCNGLIIIGIKRASETQKKMINNKSDQMVDNNKQQQQLTRMLVSVSLLFVILNAPNAIFFIVKPYLKYEQLSYDHALVVLVQQIVFILSDSNHAVNFYLYFATGRKFRVKFMDVFCCRQKKRRSSQSTNGSGVSTTRTTQMSKISKTDV